MEPRKKLIEVALPLKAINQASVRKLASRLNTFYERKKRAVEAISYKDLVQGWLEIVRLARENGIPHTEQTTFFGGDEV
ncbi:MAG: hypothetical protein AA908_07095 [Chlorobi bacterium NICIL-2]|nr:MAG: hypothetical protein AA908_07095 [Chlorobi bacterium NICIL-2]GIV04233.1 MAG: hypothetical protein KatS3mg015_3063 [Fimbriimonadales bacterium]